MSEEKLWEEWWKHFIEFERNFRRIWEYSEHSHHGGWRVDVDSGRTYAEYIEDSRKEWFKEKY